MNRSTKRWVIRFSALLGLIGLVAILWAGRVGGPAPLWGILLLSYGVVFLVILPMNWIGQQFTRFRSEQDLQAQSARRVRPLPAQRPGQQLAVAAPYVQLEDIKLVRVTPDWVVELQGLVDQAATELAALEDRIPDQDAHGHVVDHQVSAWLSDRGGHHPFAVRYQQQTIGFVLLEAGANAYDLTWIYVLPVWRRRHMGLAVMGRVLEFGALLGEFDVLRATVPEHNARARMFLQAAGFVDAGEKQLTRKLVVHSNGSENGAKR